MSELLKLSEVCEMLGISVATGNNWIRLGKLIPSEFSPSPMFNEDYICNFSKSLMSDSNGALKSRRNKTKISGNSVYRNYILPSDNVAVIERIISFTHVSNIRAVLANLALQLILNKSGNLIVPFTQGIIDAGIYAPLVKDLLGNEKVINYGIYNESVSFIPGEDTLGFAYISLSDIGKRKSTGAYYTPYNVVKKLADSVLAVESAEDKKIFDPCCGTGNFLIYMSEFANSPYNLFGRDTDEISIAIARINIALNCRISNVDFLYDHFTVGDTLVSNDTHKYDIIIGNPPWGSHFTNEQKQYLLNHFHTASKKGMESCGLFIERSLSLLKDGGRLAFVLPKSVLTVRSHQKTREVMSECSLNFAIYLENAFSGVLCPAVILGVTKDGKGRVSGCRVTCGKKTHVIEYDRASSERFLLDVTDKEFSCLDAMKIGERRYLKNNAVFALGIVTGNNDKYIRNSPYSGSEKIYRGNDVYKYRLNQPASFIEYLPEEFQQVADNSIYRAKEKLLYRFVCDTLVFAYDNKCCLSLNSCNILIPEIENMSVKYIMAVLNSRAASFWYRKMFSSVKVLRSHLEKIPIPVASKSVQRNIEKKTDLMSVCADIGLYNEIDDIVCSLYGLTDEQVEIIRSQDRNLFI